MSLKKKIIIYLSLLLIMFAWGYLTHKTNIFPHNILRTAKKLISSKDSKYHIYENQKLDKEWLISQGLNNPYPTIFLDYQPGSHIFNDRNYINNLNDKELIGLTLLQVPRHYNKNIEIELFDEVTIFRVLCDKNNNEEYKDWEKVKFKVNIIGFSCKHTIVVKKEFNKQTVILLPGGPHSTDPIFLDEKFNYKRKFLLKE